MSNNSNPKIDSNSNEWIDWIEKSIAKKQIKYYDYKHFNNIQEIGFGSSGKVYRANWKNSHNYLALKSFIDFNITAKEIVNELKLQREVDSHENVIRFYGITTENKNGNSNEYLLVLEYADSGTLRNYLSDRFKNLTWNDKLNLAFQLASAISFLHDEEIVHRDLHSNNILIHENTIKLADFGLSKKIKELFNFQSNLVEMVAYVDPQIFNIKGGSNNKAQTYSLNKKCNIYSIGILLWEISSGRPPFYNESYNTYLSKEILQGLREKPIPNTPKEYVKIYTDCWNNEPDDRPTIKQVVMKLNTILSNFQQNNFNRDIQLSSKQMIKSNIKISEDITNNLLHNQIIQNFNKINIKELEPSISSNLMIDNFSMMINEIINLLENIETRRRKHEIINYLNNHNVPPREIYHWLSINQDDSNSIFLLGIFNHFGIVINLDEQKAFKFYQRAANLGNISGIVSLGYCYDEGIGISADKQKAFELYQEAANLGNSRGIYNLGSCYECGIGTNVNEQKAFELYQKAANLGNLLGVNNLGHFYLNGFGTNVNKQKAFELFHKAANLGNYVAQYNLAFMYEKEEEIVKDIDQAIYWYKKSAEQGYQDAKSKYDYLINHN
ncbi:hypothetical protein RclHR1_04780008 [Rhizophagus clarus]|uniref:Kinase-like domain-containing protein n=1 Tax=Rhizophagus clarus TaxID=94130 RepID=A0A2Z6RKP6_9GLOM|nr:hypothetical protein RclHR1_04780008 [Rhizophagus clarus]GES87928.1 kinase-like domain-containing protein [Rhizophagus clarus]